jgi:Zn-dependent M16 (insulinase) family peptidase
VRSAPSQAGFATERRVAIAPIDAALTLYVHANTGARHLHLDTDDEDNAFLLAFSTPAPNSSGVGHVLEHVVLCGSERYPSHRAFFAMLGRTLSTTMNAFSTEDCTAFHFSTRSLPDFENLLSVYLDAAFFPRLDPLDFHQEGCRLEFERIEDPDSPLVRRGVVLNEMKGLMSEPDRQLQQALNQALFPSTPYRFNAGGDPWHIPDLAYEDLRAYHRQHYHPSNAIFLSAGKVQAERIQRRLEDWALARFSRAQPPIPVWEEPARTTPGHHVMRVPVAGGGDRTEWGSARRTSVAIGWLLGDTADPLSVACARLLSRCLLEQGAAPLREALERAEFGARTLFSGGVQESRHRVTLHCGLRGCDAGHAAELEARVLDELSQIAREGLAADRLQGTLDQMERELLERDDSRYPYPLKLLTRMLPPALYGGDVAAAVEPSAALASLRELAESRQRSAELVRRMLLENPSRVRVTLVPDREAGERLLADDRIRLARQRASMGDEARMRVVADAVALRNRQGETADEDSLPTLGLDAVGPAPVAPRLRLTRLAGMKVWISTGPASRLIYARLALHLPRLESDLVGDVGTYSEALAALGHGSLNVHETRARIDRVCDHLSVEPRLLATEDGVMAPEERPGRALVLFSGRALHAQQEALATVMADASMRARFDDIGVLREVLTRAYERRSAEVARWGHLYAQRAAAACLDGWGALSERWEGMTSLNGLKLAVLDDTSLVAVQARLVRLCERMANATRQLQLVFDEGTGGYDAPAWARLAGPPEEAPPLPGASVENTGNAWLVDVPVNYCARVFPAVAPSHEDAAPLAVLAAYLSGSPLQTAIRERGGAYGVGARYCTRTNTIRLFSYRDPRLGATLADFEGATEQTRDQPPIGRHLDSAILRVVRELDRSRAFQGAAMERYLDVLHGRDAAQGERLRAAVLKVEAEQIGTVADRYLSPEHGRTGVLAAAGRARELEALGLRVRRL